MATLKRKMIQASIDRYNRILSSTTCDRRSKSLTNRVITLRLRLVTG